MKIAVLGGGNGSFAAAADFALAGHEVALVRRDRSDVDAHLAAGATITLIDGKGRRVVPISHVTGDLAAAVRGAELILCPTPAFAQEDLARRVAPLLEPGQVVYLPPGTFGSYIFAKAAHDVGRAKDVSFAETGTLPWLARKQGPYEVRISGRGVRLPTGVFPLTHKMHALDVIGRAFPKAIEDCGDRLGYFHIGESHRGYLGTGMVNFTEVFRSLARIGYQGPIAFESFSSAVVDPALSNMLGVWRNLWSDGYDLARHAKAFMEAQLVAAKHATAPPA